MFTRLIRDLVWALLHLRYRIRVKNLETIAARGTHGILFLPSHPALIDPVIVMALLWPRFAAHAVANRDAVDIPGVRWLARRFGVRAILRMATDGVKARAQIAAVVAETIAGLRAGENQILYPSGGILRTQREEIGGNSAVEMILHQLPEVRVVLLRTRGLWGSSFGMAPDPVGPNIGRSLLHGLGAILRNVIFFTPRRVVTIEFVEPTDLPRQADRLTLNRYLEDFYNVEPLPRNTYVPYTIWERRGVEVRPEPVPPSLTGGHEAVPPHIRALVLARLVELSGQQQIRDADRLAHDLGLDSLARAELMAWLEEEFAFPPGTADALQTVHDVLLAAAGEAVAGAGIVLRPVPPAWLAVPPTPGRAILPPGTTITEVFLRQASQHPDAVILADQRSGVRTYRGLITAILALLPALRALPGEHVGIMLPASVGAVVAYLGLLFAGKTPVMMNWTVGRRNLHHALALAQVQRVLTSEEFLQRLERMGTDVSEIRAQGVFLEALGRALTPWAKLRAALASRLPWRPLWRAQVTDTAVILFTSGSESWPKGVPLTHENLLTNLRDITGTIPINRTDRLLGILPPFHSFGITGNLLLSVCGSVPIVFHPNPTEGPVLARLVEAYQTTLAIGTPTFLAGMARAATTDGLASLRLIVTGAEECPPRVFSLLHARAPQATIIEGYGVTECSPVIAVNDPAAPRPGTIGRVMPSLNYRLLDPETDLLAPPQASGMLIVRGSSVFGGYLGDAPSPFVSFEGVGWYRTGDLVSDDGTGWLTFKGRLKRFVKIGGEMISLPAIESVLEEALSTPEDDGPTVAVVATQELERPELILFTRNPIERETANRLLRAAGLTALYNVRQVRLVDSLPLLGTGKTDYRTLQAQLQVESS
jgi:acyl-CoA synthetase (AMP-forming)/AMP-acid ligase II/1-acyl-sn-glycerol-3-phosphate acyltransferase/acyl carrier protein